MANDAKIATLLYDDDDAASQCVHLQTWRYIGGYFLLSKSLGGKIEKKSQ